MKHADSHSPPPLPPYFYASRSPQAWEARPTWKCGGTVTSQREAPFFTTTPLSRWRAKARPYSSRPTSPSTSPNTEVDTARPWSWISRRENVTMTYSLFALPVFSAYQCLHSDPRPEASKWQGDSKFEVAFLRWVKKASLEQQIHSALPCYLGNRVTFSWGGRGRIGPGSLWVQRNVQLPVYRSRAGVLSPGMSAAAPHVQCKCANRQFIDVCSCKAPAGEGQCSLSQMDDEHKDGAREGGFYRWTLSSLWFLFLLFLFHRSRHMFWWVETWWDHPGVAAILVSILVLRLQSRSQGSSPR